MTLFSYFLRTVPSILSYEILSPQNWLWAHPSPFSFPHLLPASQAPKCTVKGALNLCALICFQSLSHAVILWVDILFYILYKGKQRLGEIKLHCTAFVRWSEDASPQYPSSSLALLYSEWSPLWEVTFSITPTPSWAKGMARKPGSDLHLESGWGWWWVERWGGSEGQGGT